MIMPSADWKCNKEKKYLTWGTGIWMTVSFDVISLNAYMFEIGNYPCITDFKKQHFQKKWDHISQ